MMPRFSQSLEMAIHQAFALANARNHEVATLEHLLLGLIDEENANRVLRACSVDIESLRSTLIEFIDDDLSSLETELDGTEAVPTAAFQRVLQRASMHVQSSGRPEVVGANILIAIFAERETNAAMFLNTEGITRYDAVNFFAHGVASNPDFVDQQTPFYDGAEIIEVSEATELTEDSEVTAEAEVRVATAEPHERTSNAARQQVAAVLMACKYARFTSLGLARMLEDIVAEVRQEQNEVPEVFLLLEDVGRIVRNVGDEVEASENSIHAREMELLAQISALEQKVAELTNELERAKNSGDTAWSKFHGKFFERTGDAAAVALVGGLGLLLGTQGATILSTLMDALTAGVVRATPRN